MGGRGCGRLRTLGRVWLCRRPRAVGRQGLCRKIRLWVGKGC